VCVKDRGLLVKNINTIILFHVYVYAHTVMRATILGTQCCIGPKSYHLNSINPDQTRNGFRRSTWGICVVVAVVDVKIGIFRNYD
jgi:hypothetical protein